LCLDRLSLSYGLFQVGVLVMSMRVLDWAFCREPLRRIHQGPAHNRSLWSFTKDTLDLTINQRGLGWNWSRNYKPPQHTRSTASTPKFLLHAFISALYHYLVADYTRFLIQSTNWYSLRDPNGAPLFNYTLAPIPRYLLSSFISALVGLVVYSSIQMLYDMSTLILIPISNYSPLDWPPLFDAPWKSTSLVDFWVNRWHSLFRHVFIQLGVKPLTFVVGRRGGLGLLGGFIVSGILHDWGIWGMGSGLDFFMIGGYFIIQGVGVILETTLLAKLFGGKVDGFKGRVWTTFWIIVWANTIVDAWFRRGLVACLILPEDYRPSVMTYELVRSIIAI
jgi:hypothetical protein